MTIARLTAIIEAVKGSTPAPALVLRVGTNLYALTADPDPAATSAQKAVAVVALVRGTLRSLVRDGGAKLKKEEQDAATIAAINAAADAAAGDM